MPNIDDEFEPIGADQLNALIPRRSQMDFVLDRKMRELALKQKLDFADWVLITGAAPDSDGEFGLFTVSEEGVRYPPIRNRVSRVIDPEDRELHKTKELHWTLRFPCSPRELLSFVDSTEATFTVHRRFRALLSAGATVSVESRAGVRDNSVLLVIESALYAVEKNGIKATPKNVMTKLKQWVNVPGSKVWAEHDGGVLIDKRDYESEFAPDTDNLTHIYPATLAKRLNTLRKRRRKN